MEEKLKVAICGFTWQQLHHTVSHPAVDKERDSIFEARKESLSGQEAILNQRISQYGAEIEGLKDKIKAQDESLI